LVLDDKGFVVELIETKGKLKEQAGLEFYSGIVVPGFVNTHCHIEFSHLKNKIEKGMGLGNFIGGINKLRNAEELEIFKAAVRADREMQKNGIVAVGDVSNSSITLKVKKQSPLNYHTFIEVFGFLPERANRAFDYAKTVFEEFKKNSLPASVVPHSPYSVSAPLFELIKNHASAHNSILSIHNQESPGENEFYQTGEGEIVSHLKNNIGLDISGWMPTGKNSLPSILKKLPLKNKLLLVHNTFTSDEDIIALKKHRPLEGVFFVLCPNANLYITKSLPPVNLFHQHKLTICLGTDSLASNSQLSILSEMMVVQNNFKLNFEELLLWATLNGAKALGMEHLLGSFEPGKRSGVNLLTKINFKDFSFTSETHVKRLV